MQIRRSMLARCGEFRIYPRNFSTGTVSFLLLMTTAELFLTEVPASKDMRLVGVAELKRNAEAKAVLH